MKCKIDDPVDASAVHGACGFWGCLAKGFLLISAIVKTIIGVIKGDTRSLDYSSFSFSNLQFLAGLLGEILHGSWQGRYGM